MKHEKREMEVVQEVVVAATELRVQELNELQLALVGGGIGDFVSG